MKIFKGTILKKNGEKTAVVAVTRVLIHPVYKKRVKRTRKYHVHDEFEKSKVGQQVQFVASRPFSKTKKWKLFEKKVNEVRKSGVSIKKISKNKT